MKPVFRAACYDDLRDIDFVAIVPLVPVDDGVTGFRRSGDRRVVRGAGTNGGGGGFGNVERCVLIRFAETEVIDGDALGLQLTGFGARGQGRGGWHRRGQFGNAQHLRIRSFR